MTDFSLVANSVGYACSGRRSCLTEHVFAEARILDRPLMSLAGH